MTRTMSAALIALALAGGSLAVAPARADETTTTRTTVTTTGPAFGYDDGYWDRGHAWHAWSNEGARVTFEKENHTHFYHWKHNRDGDMGWREHDVYWNH